MKKLLILSSLGLLAACQQAPTQHAPASASVEAFAFKTSASSLVGDYQDDQLTELANATLVGNTQLRQAEAGLAFAIANTRKTNALNGPTLSLGGGYTHDSETNNTLGVSSLLRWERNLGGQEDLDTYS